MGRSFEFSDPEREVQAPPRAGGKPRREEQGSRKTGGSLPRSSRAKTAGKGPESSPEAAALAELASLRDRLLQEQATLDAHADYLQGSSPDACCRRPQNQMRMTPLEAKAIAEAFAREPELQARLPEVLQRLRRELAGLKDNDQRQHFECPLLEQGRCLVHRAAKPIGCLAWHPAPSETTADRSTRGDFAVDRSEHSPHYTPAGWDAFAVRDALNDAVYGQDWKARVIPLWLRRVFAAQLARTALDAAWRLEPRR